eukprot:m.38550 g.38550  ORF g.38550 m.38550 type:complete len:72 (+) comp13429_c0_seq2:260-475(+)
MSLVDVGPLAPLRPNLELAARSCRGGVWAKEDAKEVVAILATTSVSLVTPSQRLGNAKYCAVCGTHHCAVV